MDQKGYVMGGLSFLLILPAILLVAVFADMTQIGGQSVGLVLQSDTTFYAAKDIERNVPLMGKEALKGAANDAVATGNPHNPAEIKDQVQTQMNLITAKYRDAIGADNVSCTILGFGSSSDPFLIEVNSTIYVKKGTSVHEETITQDIDIKGLPDPLPFIKLKNFGNITLDNNTGRISYGSTLTNYLNSKGLDGSIYNSATSPGFITQCNFEPYANSKDGHGAIINKTTLKIESLNLCLSNGYYHESNDGACYLCRLQGLALCSHYGLETFIVPPASNNNVLIFAPVSVDHVLFGNTYSGQAFIYYEYPDKFPTSFYKLYLDDGHRAKYGLFESLT